ncbi:MAG: hypothetical protein GY940_19815 [bacterium]|nr:hypothetical protein [bacterium]
MKYNPDIHHRRSIRLDGYDYSQDGLYFITICIQNQLWLLGEIENGEMVLNDAGQMVKKWWYELNNKYGSIELHDHIIMPNHFHGIIQIKPTSTTPVTPVGADLCVCPNGSRKPPKIHPPPQNDQFHRERGSDERIGSGEHIGLGEHIGSPLHRMVQWFKTMTTNEYIRGVKNNNWPRFDKKLWQRNYYEHIIRDENSYDYISEYIQTNPERWKDDELR